MRSQFFFLHPTPDVPPSRPEHLRLANARCILRLLRSHSPCSKADLVRLSNLSAPTVASAVRLLRTHGLIRDAGDGISHGGRPPSLLVYQADHAFVAAADIGGTRLRMMLADLNGKVHAQWATDFTGEQRSPRGVCGVVREGLRAMCRTAKVGKESVAHLTAGAPGITNVTEGIVLSAPNLSGWENVPLRALLARATGLPVCVENDTNLAAAGEHWNGAAENVENFLFVALGTGIGAGIYLRGRPYHGANWSAGEIGYMTLDVRARTPLQIHATGDLDRALGGQGIATEWRRRLRLAQRSGTRLTRLRATEIFDLAVQGDSTASEVLEDTARSLAGCLSDLALAFDPELIVLGGGVGSHPALRTATETILGRNEFARPKLLSSSLRTQAQLYGALAVSLEATEDSLIAAMQEPKTKRPQSKKAATRGQRATAKRSVR